MTTLRINLFSLVVEVYVLLALLFEFPIPGASFLHNASLAKLFATVIPLILVFVSRFIEGWSPVTLPTALCALMIPLAAATGGFLRILLAVLVSLLTIAHFIALKNFRVKSLLKPTGRFPVGYKLYKEDESQPIYGVFYPATERTNNRPTFLPDEFGIKKFFEITLASGKYFPRWLFNIAFHFTTMVKLSASIDAPLVSSEELKEHTSSEKLIPIIFSHGLGACRHNYASLLTQLASKGYFVISMDHKDEVLKVILDMANVGPEYLEKRVKEARSIIDELSNASGSIGKLFGNKLNLDMSRLTVMGHSFGGVTAYTTAVEDGRIKHCVMIDPWLMVFPFEKLDKKLDCSVLLLESGDWNESFPIGNVTARNMKVMEGQKGNSAGAIYCKIPNSQHNHFIDNVLLSGGVFKYLNFIADPEVAGETLKTCVKALDDYFSVIVSKKQESSNFKTLYEGDKKFPLVIYS